MDSVRDLSRAIVEGIDENPPWNGFLELLREKVGAEFATLLFRPPGWRHDESLQLISGDFDMEEGNQLYRQHISTPEKFEPELMLEERCYSLDELRMLDQGDHAEFYDYLEGAWGVSDLREMRVREASGVNAWLTIIRMHGRFKQAHIKLMSDIAPLLRGVLRTYVRLEQQSLKAQLAEEAISNLRIGWFTLDSAGRLVDADNMGREILGQPDIFVANHPARVTLRDSAQDKTFHQTLNRFAAEPDAPPIPIQLRQDPTLDLLLAPSRLRYVSTKGTPAAIAYVHGDTWSSVDRRQQLIDMFSLSKKEAELALALCRGKRIAEAAGDVGITTETARSYSKAIYAKTGTRGLSDLVRTIMGSVLAIAPHSAS
ncbi:MAG: hypothetical protein KDE55_21480 [Novosphingobium sp.]|nr:hypothetical protein [Novosphingobium sp.]